MISESYMPSPTATLSLTGYWWVAVTMTTVGYGDYYPTSMLGHLIAILVMSFGLILTALPVAIIGGNFTLYYEYSLKRKRLMKQKKKNGLKYEEVKSSSTQI